jgi:hypothetical protein
MAFDPSFFVTHDRFAVPCKRNRLDVERGFLAHLTNNRIGKLLASFNTTARQSVKVERRLARAPHDQHPAVAEDGCAHRKEGALRIGSLVSHARYRFIS